MQSYGQTAFCHIPVCNHKVKERIGLKCAEYWTDKSLFKTSVKRNEYDHQSGGTITARYMEEVVDFSVTEKQQQPIVVIA